MGWKEKKRLTSATIHIFLIIGSLCMLIPFAWMILTAFKTKSESISVNPFYIFPAHGWHIENFMEVWSSYNFALLYKNTLILVQMMVPGQIYIIPQYLIISRLHMMNTQFALVFPGMITAFGTYMCKQGYQSLPISLEEAAEMDGCSIGRRFVSIMLPLTRSSLVSLGIFTALFAYKDLMWPMIVCPRTENTTLTAALSRLQGQFVSNYPQIMAAAAMYDTVFQMLTAETPINPFVTYWRGLRKHFVSATVC